LRWSVIAAIVVSFMIRGEQNGINQKILFPQMLIWEIMFFEIKEGRYRYDNTATTVVQPAP
jgi:hypothetical protein